MTAVPVQATVEEANPFLGSANRVSNLPPELRCSIYRELTKWSDVMNMANALADEKLQRELYSCIEELDFSNGVSLVQSYKDWFIPNRDKLTSEQSQDTLVKFNEFQVLRKRMTHLQAYRFPWLLTSLGLERAFGSAQMLQFYQACIEDPKARFLKLNLERLAKLTFPLYPNRDRNQTQETRTRIKHQRLDQITEWIYQLLSIRVAQWGSEFCVVIDNPLFPFIWIDGTVISRPPHLISLWDYMNEKDLPGFPAKRYVCANVPLLPLTRRVTPIKIDLFEMDRILPGVTELTFDMTGSVRTLAAIGSTTRIINAHFSIIRFFFDKVRLTEWYDALYKAWSRLEHDYPQVTHFQIPVFEDETTRWKRLFPNQSGPLNILTDEFIKSATEFTNRYVRLKPASLRIAGYSKVTAAKLEAARKRFEKTSEDNSELRERLETKLARYEKHHGIGIKYIASFEAWDTEDVTFDKLLRRVETLNTDKKYQKLVKKIDNYLAYVEAVIAKHKFRHHPRRTSRENSLAIDPDAETDEETEADPEAE